MSVTWPLDVVTATAAGPTVPTGVVTVTAVPVSVTTVAAAPPNLTEAPSRFVPLTTTESPPATLPVFGTTDVIVGADW